MLLQMLTCFLLLELLSGALMPCCDLLLPLESDQVADAGSCHRLLGLGRHRSEKAPDKPPVQSRAGVVVCDSRILSDINFDHFICLLR